MMVADTYDPPSARLTTILKDATIIQAFARENGAPTPLLDTALPIYEASVAAGLGDLDAAALLRYLENESGITR
jgi:3-hydroxyisobutyrate dehydrogenase-like beta-hydroxyacid dehydrogenase